MVRVPHLQYRRRNQRLLTLLLRFCNLSLGFLKHSRAKGGNTQIEPWHRPGQLPNHGAASSPVRLADIRTYGSALRQKLPLRVQQAVFRNGSCPTLFVTSSLPPVWLSSVYRLRPATFFPALASRNSSAFSFFSRSNSPSHCSRVRLLIVGTFTVLSSQSAASPNWK